MYDVHVYGQSTRNYMCIAHYCPFTLTLLMEVKCNWVTCMTTGMQSVVHVHVYVHTLLMGHTATANF